MSTIEFSDSLLDIVYLLGYKFKTLKVGHFIFLVAYVTQEHIHVYNYNTGLFIVDLI